MKTTVEVTLKPFTVPNYVIVETPPQSREEGVTEAPKYRLSELDPCALERLCDEFRDAVFAKAEKQRPPQEAPYCHKCRQPV